MAACVGIWSHLLLCTVETISANLAKRKKHSVFCFVLFLAETGEAQVCVVCDLCRKWRCHHRRLKWKHPGVGKRHVHSFNPSSSINTEWSNERSSIPLVWVSIFTQISELQNCTISLFVSDWSDGHRARRAVCLSICLSVNLPSSSSRPLCPTNWTFSSISSHLCHAGTNRISHVIQGAHEGSIFALSTLRNGTLVSGGKDRRLVCWDSSYQQIQTVEVGKSSTEVRVSVSWDFFESHIISGIKCISST